MAILVVLGKIGVKGSLDLPSRILDLPSREHRCQSVSLLPRILLHRCKSMTIVVSVSQCKSMTIVVSVSRVTETRR